MQQLHSPSLREWARLPLGSKSRPRFIDAPSQLLQWTTRTAFEARDAGVGGTIMRCDFNQLLLRMLT